MNPNQQQYQIMKNVITCTYLFFSKYVYDISYFPLSQIVESIDINKDIKALGGTLADAPKEGASTIFPSENVSETLILIDLMYFGDSLNKLCAAVVHELIHIHDFHVIANNFHNGDITTIAKWDLLDAYVVYSEFHASLIEDKIVQQFLNVANHTDNNLILDACIKNFEVMFQYVCEQCKKTKILPNTWHNYFGHIYETELYFKDTENVIRNKYLCQMFSSDRQLEIAKSIYNLCRNLCQSENHTYHEFLELQRLANSLSPTK